MNLKKNLLTSVVLTVLTLVIGLSSIVEADKRHGAKQR